MGTQIEILDLDTMTDEELGIQFTIEWVRVNFHDANSWFLGILEDEIEDRLNKRGNQT